MAPIFSALVALVNKARAGAINSRETFVVQPNDVRFEPWQGLPSASGEMAMLYGNLNEAGPYLVLMKWNPGCFSAPDNYRTDRIYVVVSGTWWVNSGADFYAPAGRPRFGWRVCAAPRPDLALRRRACRCEGTGGDCRIRDRSGRYPAGGSQATSLAQGLGVARIETGTMAMNRDPVAYWGKSPCQPPCAEF